MYEKKPSAFTEGFGNITSRGLEQPEEIRAYALHAHRVVLYRLRNRRTSVYAHVAGVGRAGQRDGVGRFVCRDRVRASPGSVCLLYTSDAADEL